MEDFLNANQTRNASDFFNNLVTNVRPSLSTLSTPSPSLPSSMIDSCDEDHMETFNCTRDAFVLHERGLQIQDLWDAIPLTMVYTFILAAGLVGNLIVCIVIVRHPLMHTATNYYLFNLAVSDMVYLLFGLPFEILLFWHQYPWLFGLAFCKFRALIAEACTYCSVLTIVAFSMERFLAICYPLHSYAMAGLKRAVRIIAGIWTISLLSAAPFAYYRTINYIRYPPPNGDETPESGLCAIITPPFGLYETSTIAFFVIPMLIISVLYVQMATEIRSRTKRSVTKELGIRPNVHGNTRGNQSKSRRAIIKMLAVVVITFFISWAPFHAQRVVFLYGRGRWRNLDQINLFLFKISGFFYYFSCTINPIIYNAMSQRYRLAFRETLCGKHKHRLISTPRQLSRKTTGDDTDPMYVNSQISDPFDAETGTFPRTRSMRLSQNRSLMQRTNSVQSRATSLKEQNETTVLTAKE